MLAPTLDNVNFRVLLAQHGGDVTRAKKAWARILQLGRFGDVPYTYEGGLDVHSMRVMLDEQKQNQKQAITLNVGFSFDGRKKSVEQENVLAPEAPTDLEDRIKRIEDIASGDDPDKKFFD